MYDAITSQQFWSKVAIGSPRECWPWQAGDRGNGYGQYWLNGKTLYAHRVAVELDGRSIAPGLVIDHICRNRLCCNPSHLRIVTRAVNNVENSESVSAICAAKTHCPAGHSYSEENTRRRKNGSRECRECGRKQMKAYRQRAKVSEI